MSPRPYRPEYEQLEDDEAQTAQEMAQTMQRMPIEDASLEWPEELSP